MNSRFSNFLVLLNEFLLLCGSHFVFVFTSFTTDNESKYMLGWVFVFAIGGAIYINIVISFAKIAVDCHHYCKLRRIKNQKKKVAQEAQETR